MNEKYIIYAFKDLHKYHLKTILTLKTQIENMFFDIFMDFLIYTST
jgi:hypothetical protein